MKKGKSNVGYNIVIIMLMVSIFAAIGVGLYAWAKLSETIKGTTTGEVAKWSFKVVDGIPETTDVIDFAVTRIDDNETVAENMIAPGTYGKFDIGIDARGTETILTYEIDIAFQNKPVNLIFYADEFMTEEIELDGNNNLVVSDFLSLEDVKYVQTKTIYWNWPIETGTTKEEIYANNLLDTEYMGKNLQMAITVTGFSGEQTLIEENYAASTTINGKTTKYMTLQEAVIAAGNVAGAEIKILRSRITEGFTIASTQDITIDLNSKKLTIDELITNNGKLTIVDNSTAKTGRIVTSSYISQLGTFTLNSGTIDGIGAHHVIHSNDVNANNIVNGGKIQNLYNGNYDCLMISKGNLTITDGIFNSKYRCTGSSDDNCIIKISGGIFNAIGGSNITYQAEAAYFSRAKEVTISGGTFIGSTGEGEHGSWAMQFGNYVKSATITGGYFKGGTMGIGVYSSLTISNATIESSSYSSIIQYNETTLTLNAGTILNSGTNCVENKKTGTVIVNNGVEINSTKSSGIVNNSTGIIQVNGGTVTGKTYGVDIGSGTFNFNGGTIKGKTASINGTPTIPNGLTPKETTDSDGYKVTILE